MEQDSQEVETVLAQHIVRLFKAHHLSGAQAKRLLEKVRVSIDAGERKSVPRNSERPSLAKPELLRVRKSTEKADRLQKAGAASQRTGAERRALQEAVTDMHLVLPLQQRTPE